MSVLTKDEIVEKIKNGNLKFSPEIDYLQLQSHSVDLRLGFTFLAPKSWKMTNSGREAIQIDPFVDYGPENYDVVEMEAGQFFEILPQEYVLVSTWEVISMPDDVMAVLYPRSSVNRKGLSVDLTGIVDAGYSGPLTIPIKNNTNSQVIRLHPGERFCQVVFEKLSHQVKTRKSRWHMKDVVDKGKKERKAETVLIAKGDFKKLKDKFSL